MAIVSRWRRYSIRLLIVAVSAFLPVIAALQYRSVEELTRLERENMTGNLRIAAEEFSAEFDVGLAYLYQAFYVGNADAKDFGPRLASAYGRWSQSASHPELVARVYSARVDGDGELEFWALNVQDARLEPAAVPAWARRRWPPGHSATEGMNEALWDDVPAVVVPQDISRSDRWVVVVLDMDVLVGDFLSSLMQHCFAGGVALDFDFMIFNQIGGFNRLYSSDPALAAEDLMHFEGTLAVPYEGTVGMPFFGIHSRHVPEDWVGPLPETSVEHYWRLVIRHQPGTLESAVGAIRTRSLFVNLGSLLFLAVSILLLLVATRKSERWAREQLEFVARTAHELRTPLAIINVASENLSDDAIVSDVERARHYGRLIQRESNRLSKLVENSLLHSRLASERSITAHPISLAEIIGDALGDDAFDGSTIDVGVEIGPDVKILGDYHALRCAFQNLFSNSIKYSDPPCRLRVSAETKVDSGSEAVEVVVEDRGRGIPLSELPHIFEPFFRGENARETQAEGSGIGLSLVKRIIEAHGGTIHGTSTLGQGSKFTLRFPSAVV